MSGVGQELPLANVRYRVGYSPLKSARHKRHESGSRAMDTMKYDLWKEFDG